MVCPCKGCKERYLGCHSKCDGYSKWKEHLKRVKSNRSEEAALNMYFNLPEHWKDHR